MADTRKTYRRNVRFAIVFFALAALMSFGVTLTFAAPPFTTTVSVDGVSDRSVTISGVADSPSKADHHMVVEWGDGDTDQFPEFTTDAPWNWGPVTHTYAADGSYTIVATLIHATPQGNDKGSASTTVTVTGPSLQEEEDDPAVLGRKTTKKPAKLAKLARTGPEHVGLTLAGLAFLMAGFGLRLLVPPRETLAR